MKGKTGKGIKPYFPMFIDISEKRALVVGGGNVAARRVETLLKFTDNITVIAPEVSEAVRKAAEQERVRLIAAHFQSVDVKEALGQADLVFAATNDNACNEWIAGLCREQRIPVNVSHRKELCDFYFPAVVVQENVVAGITASGLDHKKARQARMKVEEALTGKRTGEGTGSYEQ